METSSIAYETALSPNRIASVAASLQRLPEADAYKSHVTNALQSTLFTAEQVEDDRTWVHYEEIPDRTQKLIGYANNEGTLPWWLQDFDWGFALSNAEQVTADNLTALEESDPTDTQVKLPQAGNTDLSTTLAALNTIADGFNEVVDLEDESPLDDTQSFKLPEKVFDLNTTLEAERFENYFEAVIELCPPFEPTLQALNTTLAGLDRDYWELLPEQARQGLEMLGYQRSDSEYEFFKPLRTTYQTSSEFGIEIYIANPREPLGRLEQIRYESWRDNNGPEPPSVNLFEQASRCFASSSPDVDNVAKALLISPIYLKRGESPTFETTDRISTTSHYDQSQEERIRAITDVLDLDGVEFDDW